MLRLVLVDGNPEALVLVPSEAVDNLMSYQPWPPTVAVTANGGAARDGACVGATEGGLLIGDCTASPLRLLPGGGGELRIPAAWLRDALSFPAELWERWETCLASVTASLGDHAAGRPESVQVDMIRQAVGVLRQRWVQPARP